MVSIQEEIATGNEPELIQPYISMNGSLQTISVDHRFGREAKQFGCVRVEFVSTLLQYAHSPHPHGAKTVMALARKPPVTSWPLLASWGRLFQAAQVRTSIWPANATKRSLRTSCLSGSVVWPSLKLTTSFHDVARRISR